MPFPKFLRRNWPDNRALPSHLAPIPRADRSIRRWCEVYRWLLRWRQTDSSFVGGQETASLYGNFAKAVRKYLRPRVYIRACVWVSVYTDLSVYLTDSRRAARRTRHGSSSTCWPERKTAAIAGIAGVRSRKTNGDKPRQVRFPEG